MGCFFAAAFLLRALLALPPEVPATEADKNEHPPFELVTYQLVFLIPAPHAKYPGEREVQAIQEGHLRYLRRLFDEKKALIEGPFYGMCPYRSMIVLDVPTSAAAEAVLREDPWIAAGQWVPQIHPWLTAKMTPRKPAALDRTTLCYLGLLRRPAGAPDYPKEKLEEIQKGHLENIRKMVASRDLALVGPMGDDTPLRGIFVFRTTDPDRIRILVAQDPAVRAGRLELELYPWYVPEGVLPE